MKNHIFYILILFLSYSCYNDKSQLSNVNTHVLYNTLLNSIYQTNDTNYLIDTNSVLVYDVERQIRSRIENYSNYFPNIDTIYKSLIVQIYHSNQLDNKNLIASVMCNKLNKKIFLSKPIFNKDKDKAIIFININCGLDCEEIFLFLLQLKNGNWQIVNKNLLAVS